MSPSAPACSPDSPSEPKPDRAAAPGAGTPGERLGRLRRALIGWLDLKALDELRQLQALPLSSAEAVEIEAYALLFELNTEAQRAMLALQRCSELMSLAQGLKKPLCEAAVWRVMHVLQSFLMLHPAALHSAGMAARLYNENGEPDLAHMMLEARHYVLFHAQMYEDLYASCLEQLKQAGNLEQIFGCRLLWGAAGAAYNLGMRSPDSTRRQAWWREALALHHRALALSQRQSQAMMEAISLLNICVVQASLGDVEEAQASLRGVDAMPEIDQNRPGWMAWYRLAQALIAVQASSEQDSNHHAAWALLMQTTRSLQDGGLNHAAAAEAALRTVRRLGQERGRLADALWASDTLLDQQMSKHRALAKNMSDTLSAAIERPRLMQEKARLAEQGFALETSLAQRNAELSSALAKVQAEFSIRTAAEAALKRAHDELEAQVQARTAELEQALRALMKQEKQLALSRMVVGVAHEMNTPLGNARMAASTMQDQCADLRRQLVDGALRRSDLAQNLSRLQEGSEMVDRSLARAASLVERFKALAISQHQESVQTFDLEAALKLWSQAWQARLPHPGLDFELRLGATTQPQARWMWRGYPRALHEVLEQLFDNSLRHGWAERARGRLELSVDRVCESPEPAPGLKIHWHDDGPGIPAEHLPHVLEPFFSARLGQGGSGLGLSTAHSLVADLMGGRMEVHSPSRGGCDIAITLPSLPEAPVTPVTPVTPGSPSPAPAAGSPPSASPAPAPRPH